MQDEAGGRFFQKFPQKNNLAKEGPVAITEYIGFILGIFLVVFVGMGMFMGLMGKGAYMMNH